MKKFSVFLLLLMLAGQPLGRQQTATTRARSLVFTHVTVIDMTGAPPKPDMTVVVSGGRIAALGKTGSVRVPRGAQVIDASGKFLLPGLWDMHFHLHEVERTFPLFIANGVTGVRNMGGDWQKLFAWRAAVASGQLLGPRIVSCGPVIDGARPSNPDHALPVTTAAEARQAVVFLKQSGADFLKVYDDLPRAAYFALAEQAKKENLPFVGHVPREITMREASAAGQRSIEHLGTFLEGSSSVETELRNWPAPPVKDGNFSVIPARIAARGSRTLETYDAEKAEELLSQLVKHRTWQVPTLLAKWTNTNVDELSVAAANPLDKYIPAAEREGWSPQKNFFYRYRTPEFIAYQRRWFEKEMQVAGAMYRAGVPLLAGTDGGPYSVPGFGLHRELALLVEAGLTPLDALRAATINPAIFLGEADTLGTVEPGKTANLILLEANPLDRIDNTRRIDAVVVGGRYFPKSALRMMLANVEKSANSR
ncbi:MAG TPA: amidohydrolase family protein [Pyrinomonadaceae bacterium]|jgi:hypothetical protein